MIAMTLFGQLLPVASGALLAFLNQLPLASLRHGLMRAGCGAVADLPIALRAILLGVLSRAFFFHTGTAREGRGGSDAADEQAWTFAEARWNGMRLHAKALLFQALIQAAVW